MKKPIFSKRSVYYIASLSLICAVAAWGWFSSSLLLKPARMRQYTDPSARHMAFEKIAFKSPDGIQLSGWFVPSAGRSASTIVVCHGWKADKAEMLPIASFLHDIGYNLLFFDFRNHGESGAAYTTLGALETRDIAGAISCLKQEKPEFSKRIGIFGASMGASAAVTATAIDRRIDAAVADCPFADYNFIVARYAKLLYNVPRYPLIPVTMMFVRLRLGFDPELSSPVHNVSMIAPRPLFLIHGAADSRVPPVESAMLYEAAGEPKLIWVVAGAGHMGAHDAAAGEYKTRVGDFFKKYLQ
jgi:fermentation-respiration switch protein FrsA (DUF1100 family)